MSEYRERFTKQWPGKVMLSVISYYSYEQAEREMKVALGAGADGVFLSLEGGANITPAELLLVCRLLREKAPFRMWFVGTKLKMETFELFGTGNKYTGLCSLSANVGAPMLAEPGMNWFHNRRDKTGWEGLFFGGVDTFGHVNRRLLPLVARRAVEEGVDVITTTGVGTSGEVPPTIEKIRLMRQAIGDHPLAVYGGITPKNVETFLPYVDAFLVKLNPDDLTTIATLADTIHNWDWE